MAHGGEGTESSDSRITVPSRLEDLPLPGHRRRARSTGPAESPPRVHRTYRVEEPGGPERTSHRPEEIRFERLASTHERLPEYERGEEFLRGDESSAHEKRRRRTRRRTSRGYTDGREGKPPRLQSEEQNADDVLNDYLGGEGIPFRGTPTPYLPYPPPPPVPGHNESENFIRIRPYPSFEPRIRPERYSYEPRVHGLDIKPPGIEFIEKPRNYPNCCGLWKFSAQPENQHHQSSPLEIQLRLFVTRRGERIRSPPFTYIKDSADWNNDHFAEALKTAYAKLKVKRMRDLAQTLFAYKTIKYVWFLQSRCMSLEESSVGRRGSRVGQDDGKWTITRRLPILPVDDEVAMQSFRYQLRYPSKFDRYAWRNRLDELVVRGAVVDLEVSEAFDTTKFYWALIVATLLSLGVALAYGFTMKGDFGTGFSIAGWMITALGFFFATVAAGEYFGLEKPNSSQGASLVEEGRGLEDMGLMRLTHRY